MWKRFVQIFAPSDATPAVHRRVAAMSPAPAVQAGEAIYPPSDRGLPIQTSETLIGGQAELISMLRLHAASGGALFDSRFLAPIHRLAEYTNTLPGSSSAAFSGAGGLFRAALELGFAGFRASDGRIFTGSLGVEDRHKLEARWRYVCFAAGLLYPVGGALANMLVMAADGKQWSPELESLAQWASTKKVQRVYVTWHKEVSMLGPNTLAGTFALTILGRDNVEWLNDGSQDLVKALVNIITGSSVSNNLIAASLTKEMWAAITTREMARLHQNYGKLTIGSNVAPYLLDAMVELAKTKWRLNESVLYLDGSGLYLEWPVAGRDIVDFCSRRDVTGIPTSEAALLELMTGAQLVEKGADGVGLSEIADTSGEIKTAVRVLNAAMLVSDDDLALAPTRRPVSMKLVMAQDPLRPTSQMQTYASPTTVGPVSTKTPAKAKVARPAPALEQVTMEDMQARPGSDHESEEAIGTTSTSSGGVSPVIEPGSEATKVQESVAQRQSEEVGKLPQAAAGNRVDASAQSNAPGGKPVLNPGAIVEGGEIRYSDLLPADVAAKLKPHDGEILGKLIHLWRKKATSGKVLRLCEHGAAFDFGVLKEFARDPPGFLTVLGELGMLYLSPTHGAKKVFPVPVSEGSQSTVVCFILAHHAARKLRLD